MNLKSFIGRIRNLPKSALLLTPGFLFVMVSTIGTFWADWDKRFIFIAFLVMTCLVSTEITRSVMGTLRPSRYLKMVVYLSFFLPLIVSFLVFYTNSNFSFLANSGDVFESGSDHLLPPPSETRADWVTNIVQMIPPFPWPPPEPSAKYSMRLSGPPATLQMYDNFISAALTNAGYAEMSYFQVPRGFALVTRLECIDEEGCPLIGSSRWVEDNRIFTRFSLSSLKAYLTALFGAHSGTYRVNVFIVTDAPFSTSPPSPTEIEATSWLAQGVNVLPRSIATNITTPDYTLSVLIYEFNKSAADGHVEILPQGAPIAAQLSCTGIKF